MSAAETSARASGGAPARRAAPRAPRPAGRARPVRTPIAPAAQPAPEEEDRAPVERLGQRAAGRRPEGGGEDRGAEPQATPGARAPQQLEDDGEPRGGAERLRQRAGDSPARTRRRRTRGWPARTGEAPGPIVRAERAGRPLERDQGHREHDGVDNR